MEECNFKFYYKHMNKKNDASCWLTKNEYRMVMNCPGEDNCILFKKLSLKGGR